MPHKPSIRLLVVALLLAAVGTVARTEQATSGTQQPTPPPSQSQNEVRIEINGQGGAPPHYAVPDFLALSQDAETVAAAKTVGQVLWDDLAFEREFDLIPRDTYATIPVARSLTDVPFDRWLELGADALVSGTVERNGANLRVQVRLFDIRSRQQVFAREYTGTVSNPRFFAHTISDEIHQQQRGVKGVARTKLTFSSDRDRERVVGTIENRQTKEVYISDYDGANQRRVTVNRTLSITPKWSPDAKAIAFTSYRRGFPDILISYIYEGRPVSPTGGRSHNFLPAWSPDGQQIAFTSTRDGNSEIYVMNRDGSNQHRVTSNPAIDTTPTWSPTGREIAFTSDRTGSPQIYVMGADGLNLRRISTGSYCDRATWSPAPQYNEIAYVCGPPSRYDIWVYSVPNGTATQITHGEGSNESPSFAPNGKHIAYTSTRGGRTQVYTVARDGNDVRQITRNGNNYTPDWSN